MSERLSDASDEVLGRRLAAELPRRGPRARPPARLRQCLLERADVLGEDHELVPEYRRKMANALF